MISSRDQDRRERRRRMDEAEGRASGRRVDGDPENESEVMASWPLASRMMVIWW
jgi:hypothetical protein